LNKLKYRGCQACYACKTSSETCVLKDDLTEVLDVVSASDVVLLASPVYYGDVTGQMKTFIDRTFCFLTPTFRTGRNMSRLAPGKKLVFIQTQGAPESVFGDIFTRYKEIMSYHGFAEAHCIRACGANDPADISKSVLDSTDKLAEKIAV
jgi:multimeric flavodoxin WrbA